MRRLAILCVISAMFCVGCEKRHDLIDTGAIMVDESLISDKFRAGNTYPEVE